MCESYTYTACLLQFLKDFLTDRFSSSFISFIFQGFRRAFFFYTFLTLSFLFASSYFLGSFRKASLNFLYLLWCEIFFPPVFELTIFTLKCGFSIIHFSKRIITYNLSVDANVWAPLRNLSSITSDWYLRSWHSSIFKYDQNLNFEDRNFKLGNLLEFIKNNWESMHHQITFIIIKNWHVHGTEN